jgi:Integrase zinc binding domain/Integrase core domain
VTADILAQAKDASKTRKQQYRVVDGLIMYDSRVFVPDDRRLKCLILFEYHDAPMSGHFGRMKTSDLVTRRFYWPNMNEDIMQYVRACVKCQSNKSSNQLPAGLLKPNAIADHRWDTVTMDLITQLPCSRRGNDCCVVFVDKLSKMVHYAACSTTINAPGVMQLFEQNVIRLHGLPRVLITDRDTRFTSRFWREACDKLQTKLAMSTAFHPQTDGQTERANRTLEDMLRSYVNVRHDNWDEHLAMLEFAVNNAKNESTGYSPFFMTYGRHPCGPLDRTIHSATSSVCEAGANIASEEFFHNIQSALEIAKVKLKKAQKHQAKYANKHRRECTYQEGESVLLSTEDIRCRQSDTSRKKFEPKYFGPFTMSKNNCPIIIINWTYQLICHAHIRCSMYRSFVLMFLSMWCGSLVNLLTVALHQKSSRANLSMKWRK